MPYSIFTPASWLAIAAVFNFSIKQYVSLLYSLFKTCKALQQKKSFVLAMNNLPQKVV
jgi:hypothetical protein